ncbi:hypothetical protein QBC37DRAFT_372486 [Rhypophila decipiens]|uniref:Uncharacterized protein n=1 Tax=Rhypophila decipiens TaxID=261697 RepID=A0AAN6YA74_9PEZI|nr:hypothetical protein QBC37DRAFT_372486 [Rhypophila decipiens]
MDPYPPGTVIPATLISRETLEHVGFTKEKGDELWSEWLNSAADDNARREGDPEDGQDGDTFKQFILDNVKKETDTWDTWSEDDDGPWYACLTHCGINTKTQEAIMEPAFKYLREDETCIYLICDTIEMRYGGLEFILRRLPESSSPAADATPACAPSVVLNDQGVPGETEYVWGLPECIAELEAMGITINRRPASNPAGESDPHQQQQ